MFESQCACSRTVRYARVPEACPVSPAKLREVWRNAVPARALTQRHALFAKCSYDTSYAAPFVVACTPSLRSAVPAVHSASAASIAIAVTVPCPSIPAHSVTQYSLIRIPCRIAYSAWYAYERILPEMRACVRDDTVFDSVRCVTWHCQWQRQAMCQRLCAAHASNALLWIMSVTRMFVVPYGVAGGAVTSSSTSSSSPGGEHPCYYFIYEAAVTDHSCDVCRFPAVCRSLLLPG